MVDIKKFRELITVETVSDQIKNGWTNPFFIATYILGNNVWESLPEWDRRILAAHVHKIITENRLL